MRILSMFIGSICFLAIVSSAHAQTLIETVRPAGSHSPKEFIAEQLHPTADDPLQYTPYIVNEPMAGSHLRIKYTSDSLLPIVIGFEDMPSPDFLMAVLPPSDNGDVLLSLSPSPLWNKTVREVGIDVYSLQSITPEILSAEVVNRTSFPQDLGAFVRHGFKRESFGASSVNYLYGYRVGNIPITLALGLLLVLILIILNIFKKCSLKTMSILCLSFLLLYQARFLWDVASASIGDLRAWNSDGAYSSMSYTYAIADVLKADAEESTDETHVMICNELPTPYFYLLHPLTTSADSDFFPTATHAVVMQVWDENQTIFDCKDQRRAGSILHLYPDGSAAIRLVPSPI